MSRCSLAFALAACGASASEVQTAKTTGYSMEPGALFDLAIETAAGRHRRLGYVPPGDATWPSFVDERADTLAVAIYEHAQRPN